jgi:hypothetical protein
MKHYSLFKQVMFISLVALFVLACSLVTGGGSSTPVATAPPKVADTAVAPPIATDLPTLEPTATEVPVTPTPAPVGVPVKGGSYEVTVIKAVSLKKLYPGGTLVWTPKAGYMIVDVAVKVTNLTGSSASVPWKTVFVTEKTGDSWYPNYGTYKESGSGIDPFTLGISETNINGDDVITFNGDIYLRLIFMVKDYNPTTLMFGFGDSPLIEIVIKK